MEDYSFRNLVVFLIIGGLVGWVAGLIVRGRGFGILADVAIGIFGAMLGSYMARLFNLSVENSISEFLLAVFGAVILVGLTRFVVRTVAAPGNI